MSPVAFSDSLPRVSVEYIALDDRGNAHLAGHRIKVKHLVGLMRGQGYTAEQLHTEAYPHLSRAQIHAALAYYYDHQEEIDRQIREDDAAAEEFHRQQQKDPKHQALVAKMRSRWEEMQKSISEDNSDSPQPPP